MTILVSEKAFQFKKNVNWRNELFFRLFYLAESFRSLCPLCYIKPNLLCQSAQRNLGINPFCIIHSSNPVLDHALGIFYEGKLNNLTSLNSTLMNLGIYETLIVECWRNQHNLKSWKMIFKEFVAWISPIFWPVHLRFVCRGAHSSQLISISNFGDIVGILVFIWLPSF